MPLAKLDASWFDYISHLQILANWLVPLELWLTNYKNGPQDAQLLEQMRYSNLIMLDLNEANVAAIRHEAQAGWPKQECAAYRWGISYVVEGSQLGGAFLYKRLAAKLAPHKLGYLQTKQPGRWPAFLQAMAANVITPMEINSACAGAVDAFDALLQQLPARE